MAEISALNGGSELIYSYLNKLWQLHKLNWWHTLIRSFPMFKEHSKEPEFLQVWERIEKKFEQQREQTRLWPVENDML